MVKTKISISSYRHLLHYQQHLSTKTWLRRCLERQQRYEEQLMLAIYICHASIDLKPCKPEQE